MQGENCIFCFVQLSNPLPPRHGLVPAVQATFDEILIFCDDRRFVLDSVMAETARREDSSARDRLQPGKGRT